MAHALPKYKENNKDVKIMVKGIYHLAAGMVARQRNLEVIANNLANASTVGFKEERVAFRNTLNSSSSISRNPVTAGEKFVVASRGTQNAHQQGTLKQTENPLDLAIVGDGYFVVETENGPAYTRDGRFQLNAEGELVNLNGYRVLTTGGPIQIPEGNLKISSDGELILKAYDTPIEQVLDRFLVVTFENPSSLQPGRDGLLFTQQRPFELDQARLQVGYLEESNVDMVSQMIEMIEVSKMYEASAKAVQTSDNILGKAVNEVGKAR